MSFPPLPPSVEYPHTAVQQAHPNEKHQAYTDFHDGHPGQKAAENDRPFVARTHAGRTYDTRNDPVISRHTDVWGGYSASANEKYKIQQRYRAAVERGGASCNAAVILKYHLDHWDDKKK